MAEIRKPDITNNFRTSLEGFNPGDTLPLKLGGLTAIYNNAVVTFSAKLGSPNQPINTPNVLPAFVNTGNLTQQLPADVTTGEVVLTLIPTQTANFARLSTYTLELQFLLTNGTVESWQIIIRTGQDIVANVIPATPAVSNMVFLGSLAVAPAIANNGDIYYNSVLLTYFIFNGTWQALGGGGGGSTNLSYTTSPTNGIVNSSNGAGATIPLAGALNAGLMSAAEKTKLANTTNTNSGDQDLSGLAVKANNLVDLTNIVQARSNLGLGSLSTQSGTFSGTSSNTNTGDQDLSSLATTANLTSGLATKQNTLAFTPENTANKNQISGYAGLDGAGRINPSQLPALAITDTFVVASQAGMLALTAETGDVAVRTDVLKSFILRGTNPTILADWQELLTPADLVASIFGRNGVVTPQSGDYNTSLVPENTNLYFTFTRVLGTFLTGLSTASSAVITAGSTALEALGQLQAQITANIASIALKANTAGQVFTGNISATNLSNSNTGDNATNSQYSALISNANHTGDVTGSTALTLATVNSTTGTFGLAGSISQFAVNAKGLITSAVNVAISITTSQISDFTAGVNSLITGKTDKLITQNAQIVSYTLVLTDGDRIVTMSNASANNLTIPLNATVAFPIGTQIIISQFGAGQTTFVPTVGVTLNSSLTARKLANQFATATLIKLGTDTWLLSGNIIV